MCSLQRNQRVVKASNLLAAHKGVPGQPPKRISKVQLGDPQKTPQAKAAQAKLGRIVQKKVDERLKFYQPQQKRTAQIQPSSEWIEHLFQTLNSDTYIRGIPLIKNLSGPVGSLVITPPTSYRSVIGIKITGDNTTPFEVGWEWLTGTGARAHYFTNGDHFTELLRQHSNIEEARSDIRASIRRSSGKVLPFGRKNYALGGVDGVPKYFKDYTTLLTFGTTGNLAVTYLGSYRMEFLVLSVDQQRRTAQVRFCVENSSTIASATHPPIIGYTPWWNNNIGKPLNDFFSTGPLSETRQYFEWIETIHW